MKNSKRCGTLQESGFTKIENDLFEAILAARFNKRELLTTLAMLRKTNGFQKKTDDISLSQLSKLTGLDPANISKSINDLVKKRVLSKRQGKYGHVIGIQKDFTKWKPLSKQQGVVNLTRPLLSKQPQSYCQNDNKAIVKTTNTKENSKRKPQKKISKERNNMSGKPDPAKLKENNNYKQQALNVLDLLNLRTGKNYQTVDANMNLIIARLKEGATESQARSVVAIKCRQWLTDEKMNIFLRPKTLFNKTNFWQYVGELPTQKEPKYVGQEGLL